MSEDSRLKRVMQILTAVLEHPEKERLNCLRQECHNDETLLSELQSLLQHHEQAEREDFLGRQSSGPGKVALDRNQLDRDTTAHHNASTPNNALQVRCPHCHTPTSVAVDASLEDISCPSCGSVFSLVSDNNGTHSAAAMSQIGHFELIERLGFGGFGSVWKARDTKLDRTVAVKLPRQGQMDAAETEKFFREARAAAQLRHPNIVGVHEVGRDGDSIYIVSDFVRGVTLDDWLTGQQLTSREAAELCIPIAEALQHAHEQGIVHRDLKPGNIMLDGDGVPHLMDFGLARREVGEVTMTIDGQVLGTPAYMSPEQAEGQAHIADRRSDIYSLGVILFKLVTGELPFRGNTRMLIHKVINNEPPSPRTLNANVPRDLETIVLKCMEKDPERRYQTAQELADELRRFLNHEPIHARPVGRMERTWRWCKRKPVVAGLTAAVAATLLIGIVTTSFFALLATNRADELAEKYSELDEANQQLTHSQEEERHAKERAEQTARDLKQSNYNLTLGRVWELASQNRGQALALLENEELCPSEYRDVTWRFLYRQLRQDEMVISAHSDGVRQLAVSNDGTLLASCGLDGTIKIYATDSGMLLWSEPEAADDIWPIRFSPGGKLIAARGTWRRIWKGDSGSLVGKLEINSLLPLQYGFTPDDKLLLFVDLGSEARVWRPVELNSTVDVTGIATRPADDPLFTWSAVLSQDGKTFACGLGHGLVHLYDSSTQELLAELICHDGSDCISNVSMTQDGSTLVAQGFNGQITIWAVPEGRLIRRIANSSPMSNALVISHDGRFLASSAEGSTFKMWDLSNDDEPIIVQGHSDKVTSLSFSPDGSILFSGSSNGAIRIWRIDRLRRKNRLLSLDEELSDATFGPTNGLWASATFNRVVGWQPNNRVKLCDYSTKQELVYSLSVSPKGNWFATTHPSGVRIWNLSTGQQIHHLRGDSHVGALACSPDGTKVAYCDSERLRCNDIASGGELYAIVPSRHYVSSIAFSCDRKYVAAGTREHDSAVVLLDANTGEKINDDQRHSNTVSSAVFSHNSKSLASGDVGGVIRIWGIPEMELISTLRGHVGRINSLAFDTTDETLISGSADGTIAFWDMRNGQQRLKVSSLSSKPVISASLSPDGSTLGIATSEGVELYDVAPINPPGPEEKNLAHR